MNWYKIASTFRILYEDSWGNFEVLSDTGKKYVYKGIEAPYVERIKKYMKYNRWGAAWQLLRTLENR